jgi:hypothetical protein
MAGLCPANHDLRTINKLKPLMFSAWQSARKCSGAGQDAARILSVFQGTSVLSAHGCDGGGSAADAELGEDVLEMLAYCLGRNLELHGDLLI